LRCEREGRAGQRRILWGAALVVVRPCAIGAGIVGLEGRVR
jgi:hypothetical protein